MNNFKYGDIIVSGWKENEHECEWIAKYNSPINVPEEMTDEFGGSESGYFADAIVYSKSTDKNYPVGMVERANGTTLVDCDSQQWSRLATDEEIEFFNKSINA